VGDPGLGELRLARVPLAGTVCEAAGGGRFRVDLAPAQLLAEAPQLEPIVRCPGGILVGQLGGEGPPGVVVADPDLLNNQGLGRADHAALLYDLLATRLGAEGVVFDETIHGFVRRGGLLAELLSFPLLPAFTHLLLATALVVWAGAGRFGKPLPGASRPLAGKTVLIANTAALLTRGGHSAASLERYFRQTLQAVASRLHLPPRLPAAETRRRLQQLSDARGLGIDLAAVAAQVRHLAGQPALLASSAVPALAYGASPRAANMLAAAARAAAALAGRDFVIPDDVKDLFLPLMRHRVILSPGAEVDGLSPDEVLAQILAATPAPR
jgi:AAA lid domain